MYLLKIRYDRIMTIWTWIWAIRNIVAELLMPPGIWVVLGLLFLFLMRAKPKLQKIGIALCFGMVWLTSTTLFANILVSVTDPWMYWPKPIDFNRLSKVESKVQDSRGLPQAIVILGGGVRHGAIDRGGYKNQDLSKESLERVRYGAMLAKKTAIPILVSGGKLDAVRTDQLAEAQLMEKILQEEFNLSVKWVESNSKTTKENAIHSFEILQRESIKKIYLVSHFWHLPRAQSVFEKVGFEVIPVPMGFVHANHVNLTELTPLDIFPSATAITRVRQIWHELLGKLWYVL
jgi:uncharacterized SAM-binding protein YcdF (DUF218 family)